MAVCPTRGAFALPLTDEQEQQAVKWLCVAAAAAAAGRS